MPLSRANLQDVSHLVETLKAIEYCFARKDQAVAEAHVLIVRGYCETIYGITYQVRVLKFVLHCIHCMHLCILCAVRWALQLCEVVCASYFKTE